MQGAGDDEWAMGRERRPDVDPSQGERIPEPVRLLGVSRRPAPDHPHLDGPVRPCTAREEERVPHLQPQGGGRAGRDGRLDRLHPRSRPGAIDNGGVAIEGIGRLEDRQVGLAGPVDRARQVVGPGVDRARQLAIGPSEDAP